MTTLITGAAGFIGYHLSKKILESGETVIGYDNLNNYYDKNLKLNRKKKLEITSKTSKSKFIFFEDDLENKDKLSSVFENYQPDTVINLAAQAGVRYSLENPRSYINSNIIGFLNILECCRFNNVKHLLYASSSSVYGGNTNLPFSEDHSVDHPISIYAATKKSNELMAHTYSHLFNIPATGLRFFTVYGPWGRPDMALFLFTKSILNGEPINVFNHGNSIRDFTYIDDIVESVFRLKAKPTIPDQNFNKSNPCPSTSWAPHKIFNIGNSNSVPLMEFIKNIETNLGIKAKKNYLPLQAGDVSSTEANTSKLENCIGFKPNTSIKEGISRFIKWYKSYYKV